MKLFYIASEQAYINLDSISAIAPASNGEGYYVSLVHAPTQVVNSAELADILQHIGVVNNAPKPVASQAPQFKVGDKVSHNFSDSGYSDIIVGVVTSVRVSPVSGYEIVTFECDGTSYEKYNFHLTLVESVTQVTPDAEPAQADWSKLPKFAKRDRVVVNSKKYRMFLVGVVVDIDTGDDLIPYYVEFIHPHNGWTIKNWFSQSELTPCRLTHT